MKYQPIKAAAALTLAGTAASAGGMAEPVTPIEIVEVDTESRSTSSGLLIPLIIIAALVALANDSGGDSVPMEAPM